MSNQRQSQVNKNESLKSYVLDMFPYPSGEGLHMGHVKVYTASDIYARFKRLNGYEVLHPTGWDAFGLPAEQYAIKNKINPRISTDKNTARYREQMKALGLSYDWDREIDTTDPKFYKWTQWIFKQLYKKGLAYESYEPINWCPLDKTGLSNEDVEDGKCERCGTPVEKKSIRQWVLKITEYADRLIDDLETLPEWPEWLKDLQRNWVGRSEGAEIDFVIEFENGNDISGNSKALSIFTTRPDTLFGATYMVIAPEHNWLSVLLNDEHKNTITNRNEVLTYVNESKNKTELERSALGREKTGVKLEGVWAINPANQEKIPVYTADYVLANYGTGAIMAVPAHDERDAEFAKAYNIPEKIVIEEDKLINSIQFNGMFSEEAKSKITEAVGGKLVKKYKLREWVFARQRYWGEPFPVVYATDEAGARDQKQPPYLVADSELPVLLPPVESYEPTDNGESPLANIPEFTDVYGYINEHKEFISLPKTDPQAKLFKRETNTMPQWAGSSWYWLRFVDPNNSSEIFSKEAIEKWNQVDVYVGGAEHATRHLIYARFWHKFLYDIGLVDFIEPFKRIESVGLVLGEGGVKMSKRLGNVINPDDVIARYGADVARMYVMFMGPFGQASAWDEKSLIGIRRFLDRVEKLATKVTEGEKANSVIIHQTIKKIGEDIEEFKFNTAISQLMIALNHFEKEGINEEEYKQFLIILSPFAPFTAEKILSERYNITVKNLIWPVYDSAKLVTDTVTFALQIGGKLRGTFDMSTDSTDEAIKEVVEGLDQYKKYVLDEGKSVKKFIVVKNKIVNIVL